MDGSGMKELRKEVGLTQAEVAFHMAVDKQTVCRWETRVHRIKSKVAGKFYALICDDQLIECIKKNRKTT